MPNNIIYGPSCMRSYYGETISKYEAHKLKVSIIRLFNPKYKTCLTVNRLIQESVYNLLLFFFFGIMNNKK